MTRLACLGVLVLLSLGANSQDLSTILGSGIPKTEIDKDGPKPCPDEEIEHGVNNITDDVLNGVIVNYRCDEGYELIGLPTRVCRSSPTEGVWNRPAPVCQLISCPDPGIPANGRRQGNVFTYRSQVSYSCNPGYELRGTTRRACRSDKSWSGRPVTCNPVDCRDPAAIQNGRVAVVPNTLFRSRATYRCDNGYNLIGAPVRVCQQDGKWSGNAPSCRLVSCCDLEAPRDGRKIGSGVDFNSVISFACNTNFQLVGSQRRQCQRDGSWTGTQPRCEPIMCPVPRQIANGGYNSTGIAVGSEVNFYCVRGYHLSGPPSAVCQSDMSWSARLPQCIIVDCGNPGVPENGARQGNDFTFAKQVSFSCKSGYRLIGSPARFCQEGGTWSGAPAMCNLGSCGDPGAPANGDRTMTGASPGDTVSWTCNSGYRLVGSGSAECQPIGTWSKPVPICERVMCADPGTPIHGSRDGDSNFIEGANLVFSCNRGYAMRGTPRATCMADGQWSSPPPVCEELVCDDPGTPANGHRILTSMTIDSIVRYRCNPGYALAGPEQRTCVLPQGQNMPNWNNRLPGCAIVDCGDPGRPANGARSGDSTTYGSSVTYTCNTGYILGGSPAALCLASGRWSHPLPRCTPVRCPTQTALENGLITSNGTSFMDRFTATCNPGYVLVGAPSGRCQADGTWSTPKPTCQPAMCIDPGRPNNGGRTMTGLSLGDRASFFCNDGFALRGPPRMSCVPDQSGSGVRWNNTLPRCEPISCRNPGVPSNGQRNGDDFTFAKSVQFTCNEGYRLAGAPVLICLATGDWSSPRPRCEVIDCGQPGNIDNGNVQVAGTTYLSVANYRCNPGFTLVGEARLTCQPDERWSSSPPRCMRMMCADPGTPVNGMRTLDGLFFRDTVRYTCNDGYTLTGSPSATCLANQRWSSLLPTCTPVVCSDPGTPRFGSRNITRRTYQGRVDFSCNNGYDLSGSPSAICQADGTWSNPPPTCIPVDCKDPGTPENGDRQLAGTKLGDRVTFTCKAGYQMNGQPSAVCLATGRWSQPLPRCIIIRCQSIRPPDHGSVSAPSLNFQAQATFDCDTGYMARGVMDATCMATGEWSRPPPDCERVPCPSLQNIANGRVTVEDILFGATATYACNPGFRLVGSDKRECQADGTWSLTAPSCVRILCRNPGIPQNGGRRGDTFTFESTVSYTCNANYVLNGAAQLACLASGQWDKPRPRCDPSCVVGAWTNYGQCSETCGDGQQRRTRPVTQAPQGNGRPCPALSQTRPCNLRPCILCEGRYQEGAIAYRIAQVDVSTATDVLIVVDESNSMAGEHAWLPGMIYNLEAKLKSLGIGNDPALPNLYSLVGFGKFVPNPYAHLLLADDGSRLFPASKYNTSNAQLIADPRGSTEDGYQAIRFGLDSITFRDSPNIARNLIFVSDEDRDVSNLGENITRQVMKRRLKQMRFLPNVVVDNTFRGNGEAAIGVDSAFTAYIAQPNGQFKSVPRDQNVRIGQGYGSTRRDYTNLAIELKGAAWDINILRSGQAVAISFTNAFTAVKTKEIAQQVDRCQRCLCRDDGRTGSFQCAPDNKQDRCLCIANNGTWNDPPGTCSGSIDCVVSPWGSWSSCSVTCGVGIQIRSRTITREPFGTGVQCPDLLESTTCRIRDCPINCRDPGSPTNGARTLSGLTPGSTVTFSCNVGFRLVGSRQGLCRPSGLWQSQLSQAFPPRCVPLECTPGATTYENAAQDRAVATDILFVVDESSSMEAEHAWLPNMVANLDSQLRANNIGTTPGTENRYALVGFGRQSPNEAAHILDARNGDRMFPASRYQEANAKLIADPRGQFEDGYQAIDFALNHLPYRRGNNIARNVILISDEDRDVLNSARNVTRDVLMAKLRQLGFVLNVVVDNTFAAERGRNALGADSSGYAYIQDTGGRYRRTQDDVQIGNGFARTKRDYTDPALQLNGAAWDINILRSDENSAASFTAALVNVKTSEIQRQVSSCRRCTCTPTGQKVCLLAPVQPECICRSLGRVWDSRGQICSGAK